MSIEWNLGTIGSYIPLRVSPIESSSTGESYTYDVVIDWKDGNTDTYTERTLPEIFYHKYTDAGIYTISVEIKRNPFKCNVVKETTFTMYILGCSITLNDTSGIFNTTSGEAVTVKIQVTGRYITGSSEPAQVYISYGDGDGYYIEIENDDETIVTDTKIFTSTNGGNYLCYAVVADPDQSFGPTTMRVASNVITVNVS